MHPYVHSSPSHNSQDMEKKQNQEETTTTLAKVEGVGGGMEWEVQVSRCELLHIEQINNKVLLYSTGNYIQYPMINHNGK